MRDTIELVANFKDQLTFLVQEAGLEPARTLLSKGFSYYYSFHYQLRNAWRILVVCSLDSILTILKSCKITNGLSDFL